MASFIEKLATYIHDTEIPTENLCIILPSRRAAKYLQKALFSIYNRPLFSPKIITIDEWVKSCSTRTVLDSTRLLFELYAIHEHEYPQSNQGFDEFMKWGRTLLSDFDEMDRYLIPSDQLFKNLAEIKELESWNFDSTEPSPAQKRFMEFWDTLPGYYAAFNQRLRDKNQAYAGSVYKELAEQIDLAFRENKKQQYIFAGFNALSPSEISIMKQLKKMGRASILLEGDTYFFNNPIHEAGRFLRQNCEALELRPQDFLTDTITSEAKTFQVINCTQPTGQAKIAGHLLAHEIHPDTYSETVVLLGNEQLIVPVLKNIPQNIEKANITIGLPLKSTALRTWVDVLFRIQESYLHTKQGSIYHKDFIRFIKHPFVQAIMSNEDRNQAQELESKILTNNWVLVYLKSLTFSPSLQLLIEKTFLLWPESKLAVVQHIRVINNILHTHLDAQHYALEHAAIFHFDEAILKLTNILEEYPIQLHLKTFKALFNQHWSHISLAYYGNPIDGLQVMGLLETRMLAFKNLIIIGMNDGSMPPINPIQTFIPMDLRKFHHLPMGGDKQSLFAHHFYRLLPYAQSCWFTYSSAESGMGMDEPSRYLRQLKFELRGTHPDLTWNEAYYTVEDSDQDSQLISISKDMIIQQRLDDYFQNGTSASALRKFMVCPLDFYYRYLIGLGEEDSVEEEIEASSFGNFIHRTLELLYLPYRHFDEYFTPQKPESTVLQPSHIEKMIQSYAPILHQAFREHFDNNEEFIASGKNYLSLQMAMHLTEKFLKKELFELQQLQSKHSDGKGLVTIIALEGRVKRSVRVSTPFGEKEILFKGIIDRIDEIDGQRRIIDYKSGRCETKDVTIAPMSSKSSESKAAHLLDAFSKRKYVFQLLTYCFLYRSQFPKEPYPEHVGIISMNNLKESPYYLVNNLTTSMDELMDVYEEAIQLLVAQIYDPSTTFEHDLQAQYCNYCE
jgi:ATP-dependent helicase/nuclease subunit B